MEQRTYQGNVNSDALADHLVNMFNGGFNRTAAQRVGQGDSVLVQIGQVSHSGWRGIRNAIGVSITRTPSGVNISVGQSNWITDPSLAGQLFVSIWFPPLLIFPLLRGIRSFALYGQIWDAIDAYCTQVGATQTASATEHGIYCPRCGVLNHEDARFCSTCGTPLQPAQQPQPQTQAAPRQVVCGECGQTVLAAKFCSNCGARLEAGASS